MPHRILLVEDEPGLLAAIAEYLRSRGYEVHCAREREEAEALLAHFNYSLVIADLCLTRFGLDGLKVVEDAHDRPSRPKIMVLTGYGEAEFQEEARARGADAFLQKPKSLREIELIAAYLLAAKEA